MGEGRHRRGAPYTRVRRRQWDQRQRACADRIDRCEPGWVVLWALWRRQFAAFAAWHSPARLEVAAPTADGLRDLMREAEIMQWRAS